MPINETVKFTCGKCQQVLEVLAPGNSARRVITAQEALAAHSTSCEGRPVIGFRFTCGKCNQVLEVLALGDPPRAVGAQEAMRTHAENCPALAKERATKRAIAAKRRAR
jgi:ribosomal protein S27AE